MNTQEHYHIVFPNLVAMLGGASRVEYSSRFAWIHIPGKGVIRRPLSSLPPIPKWTAFNLADACA